MNLEKFLAPPALPTSIPTIRVPAPGAQTAVGSISNPYANAVAAALAPGALPTPAQLLEAIRRMTPAQKAELDSILLDGLDVPLWVPQPGPQQMARECLADIVFYGGAAGGGKTDLLIGLALTDQEHSIIFRREAVQLVGIEERIMKILGTRKGYNSQDGLWRIPGTNKVLELGSCREVDDWMKYQGRPHDAKLFDEICHFTESQFRTLIGWKRTDNPSVRQRVVCAGNPPTNADGDWVKRFWAPWLDDMHPRPAKPGELRWYITNEKGEDEEVAGPEAGRVIDGEYAHPESRTFIPSKVDDNLFLLSTGYKATLSKLPEPLRSQMLRGDFKAGATDPAWQLIPTEWIKLAMARWTPKHDKGPMTALGLDPARGGLDKTCAARRHGTWFDELISVPGTVTKDGPTAAGFVVPLVRNGACIVVDAIGIGSSALDFIRGLNLLVYPLVGSGDSGVMDSAGQLRMRNKRAEMYWRLREALDPTNPFPISLPLDAELLADLAAVRYKVVTLGRVAAILMRDKDEIREVLGRSPDKGDAVAMTFASGIPEPGSLQQYAPAPPPDWRT